MRSSLFLWQKGMISIIFKMIYGTTNDGVTVGGNFLRTEGTDTYLGHETPFGSWERLVQCESVDFYDVDTDIDIEDGGED